MAHDPYIDQEDLDVFLQEAEEHLQLLDVDIVRLEREQSNPELVQEIFRAAHTLKGSSAMLGHQQMTDVAHAIENVLDQVRTGSLVVSTRVVDALLQGLDVLRTLKEDLASARESAVEIGPVLVGLDTALEAPGPGPGKNDPSDENAEKPVLDGQAETRLRELQAGGQTVYHIRATLHQESSWAAVRLFQVLESLAEVGEVISSIPSREQIQEENVGVEIRVVAACWQGAEVLRDAVASVEEIDAVEVRPYVAEDSETGGARGPAAVDSAPREVSQQTKTVRIDVDRLDQLMNTIGELAIDRTRITQIGQALESRYKEDEMVQALGMTSAHVVKVVDELQESFMKIRMLPVATVFSGFPRMVRDLAQNTGKQVDFVVEGQETEIDRTVTELVRDPLVVVLRNAVDHGLETPGERRAAGKPEAGTLRLAAFHEQGDIVIEVEDDGRGIDAQRLKDAAVDKGLISVEAASRMTEAEALDIVFLSGFSTAEETTEVSGRGVGMDIVKTNVEAMRGYIGYETQVGAGTKITLRLPLTLANLQALLVRSLSTTYAIPLVNVTETVKLAGAEVQTVSGEEVIRLRDRVMPLLRLGNVLDSGAAGAAQPPEERFVVVAQFGDRLVGFAVESLMGLQDIMVKSLGGYMGPTTGIAGASVMGDGQVALILDIRSLINRVFHRTSVGGLVA